MVHGDKLHFHAVNDYGLETWMDASPEHGGGDVGDDAVGQPRRHEGAGELAAAFHQRLEHAETAERGERGGEVDPPAAGRARSPPRTPPAASPGARGWCRHGPGPPMGV